jgi:hypothetical protein
MLQLRTIHATLSKTLVHPDQHIKFLTIASLARLSPSPSSPPESQENNPHSLFEGTKGAKVVKLAISSVLSAVSSGDVEIVKLCAVAVEALEEGLLREWSLQKGSMALLVRLKERAEEALEGDIMEAVRQTSRSVDGRADFVVFCLFEGFGGRCWAGLWDGKDVEEGY